MPFLVRRFQRFRNLLRDRQGFINQDRTTRDPLGQRVAFHEFQNLLDTPSILAIRS